MRPRHHSAAAIACALMSVAGLASAPVTAQASEEGRRNTALGLGGLTAVLFAARGNKVPAVIALAATAYAVKRHNDAIAARHRHHHLARRHQALRRR